MITWASKAAFLLIFPILIVLILSQVKKKLKIATLQLGSLRNFKSIGPSFKARLFDLPLYLRGLGLILAVFAMARPQTANTKIKKNIEGIDIFIALDISDSMLIEDMKPSNRIEAAKDTIKKFVSKRTSDRIGLLVFAGESFTMVPLTMDYQMILNRIDEIKTAADSNIKDGTAIGVALANASGRLRNSTAKSRIVIFMTDGENNSGTIDPETGLEIAKGYGIKIYSIGIGRDGPTKIPIYQRDIFGQKVKTYQPFESHVNEDLLGRFGSETGGKFFRATRENSLESVFKEIDSLEKTKIDVTKFTRYTELFQNYLFWSLCLYWLGMFLGQTWLRRIP